MTRPVTVLLCALGGEGGGVLAQWLVDAAHQAGLAAQSTSIPGVAQRTGATTYYVEVFPRPLAQLDGRRPVFGLYPVPGALDLLVSSELLETARQIGNGMVDPARTQVITSTARTLTTLERMQLGDGRRDTHVLIGAVRRFSSAHHLLDMAAITRDSGTIVSAVMLGALAASGALPIPREAYEAVVRGSSVGAAASLRGFGRAFDTVARSDAVACTDAPAHAEPVAHSDAGAPTVGVARAEGAAPACGPDESAAPAGAAGLPPEVAGRFPKSLHTMLAIGRARVLEYQGAAYASLYDDRLAGVLAAEQVSDPAGEHGLATTREVSRWLALWMAFDDIVRVAQLKVRASRLARVRSEVRAADGDVLKVFDHFKPGVAEIAGLLPPGPAQALTRWDRRRVAAGKQPWALPLKLGTHTVTGSAALRLLGSLQGMRRRGQRFAQEQALIERWLATVRDLTVAGDGGWQQGHEVALFGRLIKGYGTTNERGKARLLHVLDHLAVGARFASAAQRARAIAQVREAALADDAGKALDLALARHGVAPSPSTEQPIRFVRRRPALSR